MDENDLSEYQEKLLSNEWNKEYRIYLEKLAKLKYNREEQNLLENESQLKTKLKNVIFFDKISFFLIAILLFVKLRIFQK